MESLYAQFSFFLFILLIAFLSYFLIKLLHMFVFFAFLLLFFILCFTLPGHTNTVGQQTHTFPDLFAHNKVSTLL